MGIFVKEMSPQRPPPPYLHRARLIGREQSYDICDGGIQFLLVTEWYKFKVARFTLRSTPQDVVLFLTLKGECRHCRVLWRPLSRPRQCHSRYGARFDYLARGVTVFFMAWHDQPHGTVRQFLGMFCVVGQWRRVHGFQSSSIIPPYI
jgi:hypothetical protein